MFKLQAFKDVQELSQGLADKRGKQSRDEYERGVAEMTRAIESHFQNKEAFKAASRHFAEAIRQNQRSPEPYLALAYLLLLYEQRNEAIKCLRQVLYLSPGHEQALRLLEYVQIPPAQLAAQAGAPALDYDKLCEDLQASIAEQVNYCRQLPELDLSDPGQVKYLQDLEAHFSQVHRGLLQHLQQLEADMDTSALRQRLSPLEQALEGIRRQVRAAGTYRRLLLEIRQQTQETLGLIQTLTYQPNAQAEAEQRLERIFDACDLIADQIDELERKRQDIDVLVQVYHQLTAYVDQLQELLDT